MSSEGPDGDRARRLRAFGLEVDWGGGPVLAGFFSSFPDRTGDAEGSPFVVVEREGGVDVDGWTREARPVLFHGWIQVARTDDAWVVWDAHDRAAVARATGDGVEVVVRDAKGTYARGVAEAALLVALRERRLFELHAAAARVPEGTWLVTGASGAGKTSAALSLAHAGGALLGDDKVVLGDGVLHAFPRPFHVGAASLPLAPPGVNEAPPPDNQKRPMDLFARRKVAFAPAAPFPDLVACVGIGPAPTSWSAIPREEALGQLVEASATAWVPGVPFRDENLARLGALASRARTVRLTLGPDALKDPRRAADVLLDAARRAA